MPATITHAYFAEDLFNLLDKNTKNKIKENKKSEKTFEQNEYEKIEEPEKTDPDEETEESSEEESDEKKKESTASMLYTPSKTLDSFLQKISATASKGTPINQLDKRLALLKD